MIITGSLINILTVAAVILFILIVAPAAWVKNTPSLERYSQLADRWFYGALALVGVAMLLQLAAL